MNIKKGDKVLVKRAASDPFKYDFVGIVREIKGEMVNVEDIKTTYIYPCKIYQLIMVQETTSQGGCGCNKH